MIEGLASLIELQAGLYAMLLSLIFVHEMGHLLAGLCCGLTLVRVRVGLFEFARPGGWNRSLQWDGAFTGAVHIRATKPVMGNVGWRYLSFVAAGPAANLLVAAMAVPFSHGDSTQAVAGKVFIFCSVAIALMNLLPLRHQDVETDGRRFFTFLVSEQRRQQVIFKLTLMERARLFKEAFEAGALEDAGEIVEDLIRSCEVVPELAKNPNARAELLKMQGTIRRALLDQADQG